MNFFLFSSKPIVLFDVNILHLFHPINLTEQLTLGSIIPDLQMAVLDVLTSLVAVCRSQLMTRATAVMNLFVQVLQWTFTPLDRRRVASERPYG